VSVGKSAREKEAHRELRKSGGKTIKSEGEERGRDRSSDAVNSTARSKRRTKKQGAVECSQCIVTVLAVGKRGGPKNTRGEQGLQKEEVVSESTVTGGEFRLGDSQRGAKSVWERFVQRIERD